MALSQINWNDPDSVSRYFRNWLKPKKSKTVVSVVDPLTTPKATDVDLANNPKQVVTGTYANMQSQGIPTTLRFAPSTVGTFAAPVATMPVISTAPSAPGTAMSFAPSDLVNTSTPTNDLQASRDALQRAYEKSAENLRLQASQSSKDVALAAKRRLSGSGISQDSGIYQKQLQKGELAVQRNLYSALSTLEIEKSTKEAAQAFDIYKMDYVDALSQATDLRKLEQTSWFNKGFNKTTIDPDELESLKTTRPDLYSSYMSGRSGMDIKQWELNQTLRGDILRAVIGNIKVDENFMVNMMGTLKDFTAVWNQGKMGAGEYTGGTGSAEDVPLTEQIGYNPQPKTAEEMTTYENTYDAALKEYNKAFERKTNIWGQSYYVEKSGDVREAARVKLANAKADLDSARKATGGTIHYTPGEISSAKANMFLTKQTASMHPSPANKKAATDAEALYNKMIA